MRELSKLKSWYPLLVITTFMWIATLQSYTVIKYFVTIENYFETGVLKVIENGMYFTENDTFTLLIAIFLVTIVQLEFLCMCIFIRNTKAESSPTVMSVYYIVGVFIIFALTLSSVIFNLEGLDRISAIHTSNGYIITMVYFVIGSYILRYQVEEKFK